MVGEDFWNVIKTTDLGFGLNCLHLVLLSI